MKKKYDFETVTDRRGLDSLKWDRVPVPCTGYEGPLVETERLFLFPLTASDLHLLLTDIPRLNERWNFCYDSEPIQGFFREIMQNQYEITLKDPENYPFHSFWMILRRGDQTVIGSMDFKSLPNEKGEVEIGYGLGRAYQNRGYMTEAVGGFCEWAAQQPQIRTILAETEPENLPSQKVLLKNGFVEADKKENLWWKLPLKK